MEEMRTSNCCDARHIGELDFSCFDRDVVVFGRCAECKEMASFLTDEEWEKENLYDIEL